MQLIVLSDDRQKLLQVEQRVQEVPQYCGLILVGLVAFVAAGCGNSGDFSTAKTTGVVLCGGKPVKGAMVYFEPIGGGSQDSPMAGKQGFSWTDTEGRFSISTYDPGGEDGAVVGKHRVRVGKGNSNCGCATNEERDLMQVEVKGGETNVFELVLPKQTRPVRRARGDDEDED